MSTLYLECNSGISGDMSVAALLDAGADAKELERVLKTIPVEGFEIKISRVNKAGLDCCDFDVVLDEKHENHDHDMEYLYGHEHDHEYEHHHHEHTNLKEIYHIIDHVDLTKNANQIAKKIFMILAEAESKAHGVSIDEVHFHEVGAVDSIVDIIAVAFCIDNLGVDRVYVPKLVEGTGTVRCQHGILSVPVPAVTNIVSANNISLEISDRKGELITPTGAAIVAAIKTDDKLPQGMKIKRCGMGAGKRKYEIPSILRAFVLEDNDKADEDVIYKLESNIDDCSGEALGYCLTKLFEAGARDAHYSPVFMKKNRPAWLLTVICDESKKEILENIIFKETTTIGIRSCKMERRVLNRTQIDMETPIGEVKIKVVDIDGEKRYYPEYDSLIKICEQKKMSYTEAYNYVLSFAKGE